MDVQICKWFFTRYVSKQALLGAGVTDGDGGVLGGMSGVGGAGSSSPLTSKSSSFIHLDKKIGNSATPAGILRTYILRIPSF